MFEIYKQKAGKRQEERERQRKEQEEYERRSREEAYKRFFGGGYSEQQNVGVSNSNFSQEELELVRGVISAGYKKMATKYHPDRGGNEEMMKLLNGIKDKLLAVYK